MKSICAAVLLISLYWLASPAVGRNATVALTPESPRFATVWTRSIKQSDVIEILVVVEKADAPEYVEVQLPNEGAPGFRAEIAPTRYDREWFHGFTKAGSHEPFDRMRQRKQAEIYYLSLAPVQIKRCTLHFQAVRPPRVGGVMFNLRLRDFVK